MPGLINKESRCALPLSVCDITSCVRGYTLALTASMTYENIEDHAIEGESDRLVLRPLLWKRLLKTFLLTSCQWLLLCSVPHSLWSLGIFIYPLEENSIVVGFEAMISSQIISLQIKGKAKIDDCYADSCHTNGALQSGTGKIEATPINPVVSGPAPVACCSACVWWWGVGEGAHFCYIVGIQF